MSNSFSVFLDIIIFQLAEFIYDCKKGFCNILAPTQLYSFSSKDSQYSLFIMLNLFISPHFVAFIIALYEASTTSIELIPYFYSQRYALIGSIFTWIFWTIYTLIIIGISYYTKSSIFYYEI
jgi:hypothetical protein